MRYEGFSPNGGDIAAVTNDDGTIFGLMDHPERPIGNEDGLKIFRNGLKAV
jgi:phosphoribosylformylglycinamidine (FGAM) synthase-like amidotransferase family enzyme